MKLLINISEYDKEWIQNAYEIPREINIDIAKAIINSEPYKPERKKGRWLTSDDMYETGVCSVCKYDSQEPISYAITMFKYCPNCGVRMEGEVDG